MNNQYLKSNFESGCASSFCEAKRFKLSIKGKGNIKGKTARLSP